MSDIRKQWETLKQNLQSTLAKLSLELPEGYNGIRFTVYYDESKDYQCGVHVVDDIEFFCKDGWASLDVLEDFCNADRYTKFESVCEFLADQGELLSVGKYAYIDGESIDVDQD